MIEIRYYKNGLRFEPTESEAIYFEDRVKAFAENPSYDRPHIGQRVKVVHGENTGAELIFSGHLFTCCLEPEEFGMSYKCQTPVESISGNRYIDPKSMQIY